MKYSLSGLLILVLSVISINNAFAETATYHLTIESFWGGEQFPGPYDGINHTDITDPHFSDIGGGTHNNLVSFWEFGELASPGIKRMAEDGDVDILANEFSTAITAGTALTSISDSFHVPAPGSYSFDFDINSTHPRFTLVSMLGPTPDWFIGVSGLELYDGSTWADNLNVDLLVYDGGTRSNQIFALGGPLESPAQSIGFTTGPLWFEEDAPIGSFTFDLVTVTPEPVSTVLFLIGGAPMAVSLFRKRKNRVKV